MASRGYADEYNQLQQMIYTRWVNQKLGARQYPTLDDVVADLGKDDHLSNLATALCDKPMPKPAKKERRVVKAQKLDWISRQLDFIFSIGVEIKLKPSNDNIYDGDYRDVMGLVYALMLKFMKFEDEGGEVAGDARDALLRWCQFHTKMFPNVQITNLTKSWQSGLALCALVAKFNPTAIVDIESLDPANAEANIKLAMDAASRHFDVEPFLTPAQFLALAKNRDGEKAMLVVISEYYYGINEWFKRQLAGKRITKVSEFTRFNDAARAKYADDGADLLARLGVSEALLADIATVDDTMTGARKRLTDFEQYKQQQKNRIVGLISAMTGAFATLNLRLEKHGRPRFVPAAELDPEALKARLAALEEQEAVEPALHAELSRQIRLVHLHAKHTAEAEKLSANLTEKAARFEVMPTATSAGDARKQLKLFESLKSETADKRDRVFATVQAVSATLEGERYERLADVRAMEDKLEAKFAMIDDLAAAAVPVLEDNLARELFIEDVEMKVDVHADISNSLRKWVLEKRQYFSAQELVGSVQEARLQLSTLDAVESEISDVKVGNFGRLVELGAEIRAAQYKTTYSEWKYLEPSKVLALEEMMSGAFEDELSTASAAKREVLEDHLARERVKEQIANLVSSHSRKQVEVLEWGKKKKAYLDELVLVTSSAEAVYQLSVLEAYAKERSTAEAGEIATLYDLGRAIREKQYESKHSTWEYEEPEEIATLETAVIAMLDELTVAHAEKKSILEDDLARELFAEETRLMAGQHIDKATQCARWANEKAAYLQQDLIVHSIREAKVGLSVLDAYETEKARFTDTAVASLKQLGSEVLGREYASPRSEYSYEAPDEVKDREAEVDEHWEQLGKLAASRRRNLTELLAREIRKEELRVDFPTRPPDTCHTATIRFWRSVLRPIRRLRSERRSRRSLRLKQLLLPRMLQPTARQPSAAKSAIWW